MQLQAKIQSLKKTATKGDKKKKKEVTEEIAKLEASLDEKHQREILELNTEVKYKIFSFIKIKLVDAEIKSQLRGGRSWNRQHLSCAGK